MALANSANIFSFYVRSLIISLTVSWPFSAKVCPCKDLTPRPTDRVWLYSPNSSVLIQGHLHHTRELVRSFPASLTKSDRVRKLTQPLLNISVASTLCSRLVLNLYDVATQDGTADSDSSSGSMTTGIFTTRFELSTSMDHDSRNQVKSGWVWTSPIDNGQTVLSKGHRTHHREIYITSIQNFLSCNCICTDL